MSAHVSAQQAEVLCHGVDRELHLHAIPDIIL